MEPAMAAKLSIRVTAILATLPGLLLAGCGDSGPPPAPPPPPKPVVKAVFVSARDCTESGKGTREACEASIDRAVGEHLATAPTYPSPKLCEAAEGTNMCERTEGKTYRPRLVAFLVTFGEQVTAVPLYSHKAEPGFRTLGGKMSVLVSDDTITFSSLALGSAEVFLQGG